MSDEKSQPWTPAQRVGFRFLFAYLVLFFFPFPQGLVNPYWLGGLFNPLWARIVPWFADLLHVTIPEAAGGSGDSTFSNLRVACMLLLAGLAAIVWSILDYRRTNYRTLHAWSRIWLRYVLAACMLTYGSVKVIMVQFESPSYGRLLQPLGQFSPMALLWIFMGSSPLYTSFTGITEVMSGLLLLFRRTTTLGAFLAVGILTNVVMLNMSYDVPVKLSALHLLFLALILLVPDMKRLLGFFLLNRPAAPADLGPTLTNRWLHRGALAIKVLFVGSFLVYLSWDTISAYRRHEAMVEHDPVPPEGSYRILSVKKDGQKPPPLTVDQLRWRSFSLRGGYVGLRSVDGTSHQFWVEGDPMAGTLVLYPVDSKRQRIEGAPTVGSLKFAVDDKGQATLTGTLKGQEIEVTMQRENRPDLPLVSRGFHWITEAPYFR